MNEMSVAARVLNRAFTADPEAIHSLVCNRVPCNPSLADDPTVVVGESVVMPGAFNIGMLGVVNGILDQMGLPKVAVEFSTEADVEGRRKIVGFCDYREPASNAR